MTFHVTACSDCHTHWIVEHLKRQDTCTCPACGITRSTDRHVSLATADDADTAAEFRARLLADDAGHLNEYTATGTYRDHETTTRDVPVYSDAFESLVDDALIEHRNRYGNHIDLKPVSAKGFEVEAERVIGTVGQEELITRYAENCRNSDGRLPEPVHPATTTHLNDDDDSNEDRLPVNSDAGLSVTQQPPVTATTEIRGEQPITDVWKSLLKNPVIQETIIRTVRELGREATYDEIQQRLDYVGLTDEPLTASYRGHIYRLCNGHDDKIWDFITELRQLGSGHTTTNDLLAAANLFRYTAHTDNRTPPVIAITIDHDAIKAMPRSQRIDVCQLLSTLSHGLDVRIVTGRVTEAWLRDQHRDDLAAVNDWTTTHQGGASLDDALATLDPDGLPVTILHLIHSKPGSTMTYNQLYAATQHSKSRVRQVISELFELGLVDTYQSGTGKKVETRPAARTVISEFDAVHGRQTRLQTGVSEPPNSQIQRRVPDVATPSWKINRKNTGNSNNSNSTTDRTASADHTATPPVEEPVESSEQDPYRTVYMPRWEHAAIVGATGGENRCVTVLDTAHDHGLDRRIQKVSVLPDEREVAMSVAASSPLSYTVGSAVALASPLVIDTALTDDVIENLSDDVPVAVLRLARQIGGIDVDSISDPESFRDTFREWGSNIADRSRELKHGEYGECQSRDEFLSELLRDAHGLYGSIVHVLDTVGYDVLRDVHVPKTVGSTDRLRDVAESIAHSVAIQSKYESFAAYRQLFEDRDEKRELAFTPRVNAADPVGEMIGGMVVRGGSAHRMLEPLQQEFESFDVHQDAPEFYVPITVQDGVERPDLAETASRILRWKGFRVTEKCVSVLYGLLQSPFGAARALNRLASPDEERVRAVSIRDIQYAIEAVGTEWLLPQLPASAGRILHALLELTAGDPNGSVTVAEVADTAGVSRQTVRNYRDMLVAMEVIDVGPDGWQCVFCETVSTGGDCSRSAGNADASSVQSRIEEACQDGKCGDSAVWISVVEALCRPDLSGPPGQSCKNDRCDTDENDEQVVVKLGPSIQQESVVSWKHRQDDRDDRRDGGDSSNEADSGGPGESDSDEIVDTDFSGVSIPGSIV